MQIKKAVIPAAGYGTRFLPATKAMPKEMLPIVDKPVIQYVVEEAVASGITDIILVTGWNKRTIEDHFDEPYELERRLQEQKKHREIALVKKIARVANFIYLRQKGRYGNGTPVLNARHLIDPNETFAVLWGDEFIAAKPPRLSQMLPAMRKFRAPVISAVSIPKAKDRSKYGIAEVKRVTGDTFRLIRLVEKPKRPPSDLAAHGAYILTPEIFPILQKLKPRKGGEIWLPVAINILAKKRPVYVQRIRNATYYDCGSKLEYLKAVVAFALMHPELKKPFRAYLKQTAK